MEIGILYILGASVVSYFAFYVFLYAVYRLTGGQLAFLVWYSKIEH